MLFVLGLAGLAAVGCDSRDASAVTTTPAPSASTAPASTSASTTVPDTSSLIHPQRLANATAGDACTRLTTKAALVKQHLDERSALSGVASAITAAADEFGAFDGLLFGEVHRKADTHAAAISTTQIDLLAADLAHHLTAAGTSPAKTTALLGALLDFRNTAADKPELRLAVSTVMVDIADLLADVQSCSPKS